MVTNINILYFRSRSFNYYAQARSFSSMYLLTLHTSKRRRSEHYPSALGHMLQGINPASNDKDGDKLLLGLSELYHHLMHFQNEAMKPANKCTCESIIFHFNDFTCSFAFILHIKPLWLLRSMIVFHVMLIVFPPTMSVTKSHNE